MKKIFESVIHKGGYDLTALLKKIDSYHIEGKLTDAERDELYAQARQTPEAQYNVKAEIEALWAAIRELQKSKTDSGETPEAPADEWPEYVQPTGAHDAYQLGDMVTYNGKHYRCAKANCVWSPDVLPDAWEEVSDTVE